MKASELKVGMVLKIGEGIAYRIVRIGLPFIADDTIRVNVEHIRYTLVVPDNDTVEIVNA